MDAQEVDLGALVGFFTHAQFVWDTRDEGDQFVGRDDADADVPGLVVAGMFEYPVEEFGRVVEAEGGIVVAPPGYLAGLRTLCDETGTLLIYDEIQCGLGRTGKLFAYEWADGAGNPDIMAVAKALGGQFVVSMEHPSQAKPKPLVLEISSAGCSVRKLAGGVSVVISSAAPRAG